jgi:riboflavin biosynthesis pyrimidine reductase
MPATVTLEPLFDDPSLPRFELPVELETMYGGPFGIADRSVYANFVSTIDGIVALPGVDRSSAVISGGQPADRFVMGLLRAAADAVVIGAETFRSHPGPWTAEAAFPSHASGFATLRGTITGSDVSPRLVVVTRSGDLGDVSRVAPSIVITTADAAERMGDVDERWEVVALPGAEVDVRAVIDAVRERGADRILTEGGPRLMGQFLERRCVDELFLTVSPLMAGGYEGRPVLSHGAELLPDTVSRGALRSVRRAESHLFLRYSFSSD